MATDRIKANEPRQPIDTLRRVVSLISVGFCITIASGYGHRISLAYLKKRLAIFNKALL